MQIIRSALIAVFLTSPVTVTSSTAVAKPANSPSPKLAQTPPMGWNSWNKFACNVSEQLIRETADAMVSAGMQSAGYQYVNIREMLTNAEVLAVNQDAKGVQGHRVWDEGPLEIWVKPLADGSQAVGLFNRGESELIITLDFKTIGVTGPAKLRDLWEHKDLGSPPDSYTAHVPKHGVVM